MAVSSHMEALPLARVVPSRTRTRTRGALSYIKESELPSCIDLVVWGHEHECLVGGGMDALPESCENEFVVLQPGSTVATALADGEARPKHVALLSLCGDQWSMQPLPLTSVRERASHALAMPTCRCCYRSRARAPVLGHADWGACGLNGPRGPQLDRPALPVWCHAHAHAARARALPVRQCATSRTRTPLCATSLSHPYASHAYACASSRPLAVAVAAGPFILREVVLREFEEEYDLHGEEGLTAFLAEQVEAMIDELARRGPPPSTPQAREKAALPLVRLKVDYGGYSTINPQRFGQRFVGRVANPAEIVLFQKTKVKRREERAAAEAQKRKGKGGGGDGVEGLGLAAEEDGPAQIQELLAEFLRSGKDQSLRLLPHTDLNAAVFLEFVGKDNKSAIRNHVEALLKRTQSFLATEVRQAIDAPGDRKAKECAIEEQLAILQQRAAAAAAASASLVRPTKAGTDSGGRQRAVPSGTVAELTSPGPAAVVAAAGHSRAPDHDASYAASYVPPPMLDPYDDGFLLGSARHALPVEPQTTPLRRPLPPSMPPPQMSPGPPDIAPPGPPFLRAGVPEAADRAAHSSSHYAGAGPPYASFSDRASPRAPVPVLGSTAGNGLSPLGSPVSHPAISHTGAANGHGGRGGGGGSGLGGGDGGRAVPTSLYRHTDRPSASELPAKRARAVASGAMHAPVVESQPGQLPLRQPNQQSRAAAPAVRVYRDDDEEEERSFDVDAAVAALPGPHAQSREARAPASSAGGSRASGFAARRRMR